MRCRRAVANIGGELHRELAGREFTSQAQLDEKMVALDGSPTKSRVGANAILAVSVAFARADAQQRGIPLYQYFADMLGARVEALPRLTINLFSGGKHAGQQTSIQDVMIIPMSVRTVDEALVSVLMFIRLPLILHLGNMGCAPRWLMKEDSQLRLGLQRRCFVWRWNQSTRLVISPGRIFVSLSMWHPLTFSRTAATR
jgi:hypothetical protein